MFNNYEEITFERCPHDGENPYAQISRDLLRSRDLSFGCKGFLSWLLSNEKNWKIVRSYIMKEFDIGKDALKTLIDEAIKAGYIKMEQTNNEKGYRITKYYVSEKPKFQIIFPQAGNPQADNPQAENPPTKEITSSISKDIDKKEQYKEGSSSAEASSLADLFLTKIKEKKENFKPIAFNKWKLEFDKLLKIRDFNQLQQIIIWLTSNDKELPWCLCPKKLAKKIDELELKMQNNKDKELIQKNRSYALEMKAQYPDKLKNLSFDDKYVRNLAAGKEICFLMNEEAFEIAFASMFGGRNG